MNIGFPPGVSKSPRFLRRSFGLPLIIAHSLRRKSAFLFRSPLLAGAVRTSFPAIRGPSGTFGSNCQGCTTPTGMITASAPSRKWVLKNFSVFLRKSLQAPQSRPCTFNAKHVRFPRPLSRGKAAQLAAPEQKGTMGRAEQRGDSRAVT